MPAAAANAGSSPTAWYSYAIVRVVPQVERGEYINVGVVLFARTMHYLEARIELDPARLRLLSPNADVEDVQRHLEVFGRIAAGEADAGPIATLGQSERFHWLTSPRSTVIQTSEVHVGRCEDPRVAIEDLLSRLVR